MDSMGLPETTEASEHFLGLNTHMLHGAGIFTYMTGSFFDGKFW